MATQKPESVNAYIAGFPEEIQSVLENIRSAILKNAPAAEEKISYAMPAYSINGKPLVYYAAFKNHIGLYALPDGNASFAKELSKYKTGKGSIQFPLDEPIPLELIIKIVRFRVRELENEFKTKSKK